MKGFKIDDPQEISAKILACDEVYCSQTFLENMQKFLPSPEQVRTQRQTDSSLLSTITDPSFAFVTTL